MKKLNLNKKVIAQLNSPNQIYGGVPVTYNCGEPVEAKVSQYFDKNITGCESGANTACLVSRRWNCPSVDASFCNTYEGCIPCP